MALSVPSVSTVRTLRPSIRSRCFLQSKAFIRHSTTAEVSTPLLAKIKNDMKTAMRAKDTARLNVLRAIISETNQAASGPSPIRSDMQLLALLKKRKASSLSAAKEAENAGRADLKEKQEKEIEILDEYAGSIKMMGTEELREIVKEAVTGIEDAEKRGLKQGAVMKELLKPGGPLEGKPVDNKALSEIVKEAIAS